jgi:tetratricopeptide (TPR) repeat protein
VQLKNAQELKQMANLDILRNDTFKCIKLYERIEELGLKNFDTMNWLSKAYENTGLTNKAVEKYRELGANTLENNLYEEAIRAYKKVVNYAPEALEAYEKLISAYNKAGQREKAAEVSAVYARRVSVFDKRKAIMVLDEANKNFPASPSNLELMATLYLEMNDKENAILTYNILANLMKKQKDVEQTLEAYRKILGIDRANIKAHLELAKGLIGLEKIPEGVAQYKELGAVLINLVLENPTNMEISDILVSVCESIIRYEQNNIIAREWLVDTYIARKDEKTALNILRELLGLLQKEENSMKLIANLRKVVGMDPEDFRSRKMLADAYLAQGKRAAAINEYMQLGVKTYEKSDMRRAKEAFEAILELDPFNLTARHKRAEIFNHLNIQVRAVEEYKLVGYLAKSVGMIPEAIQAFSSVVELATDKELGCIIEVARLCESVQDNPKAIYYYKSYAAKTLSRGNYGEAHYASSRVLTMDANDAESLNIKQQAEAKFALLQKHIAGMGD